MKALVIVDESADSVRRTTHALELALELVRAEDLSVRVFLLGASMELALAAGPGRTPTQGAVGRLVSGGVEVAVSEAEMVTRGVRPEDLILGAQPAPSSTLAAWTIEADRVLVF